MAKVKQQPKKAQEKTVVKVNKKVKDVVKKVKHTAAVEKLRSDTAKVLKNKTKLTNVVDEFIEKGGAKKAAKIGKKAHVKVPKVIQETAAGFSVESLNESGLKPKKNKKIKSKSTLNTSKDIPATKKVSEKSKKILKLKPPKPIINSKQQAKPSQVNTVVEQANKLVKLQLKKSTVESAVNATFKLIAKEAENTTELFDEETPILLQIGVVKIPKVSNRTIRLHLANSLVTPESEICLISRDLPYPDQKNYDKNSDHFQDILRNKGVENIKTVMSYHQLRSEYGEYEMQRRLVDLYDFFLVDGSVMSYIAKKFTKSFTTKRKMPTAIKLKASNLKAHIEKALCTTELKMHSMGDTYALQIGHSKMTRGEVVANIYKIAAELQQHFPGGFANVRALYLKTAQGMAIPVYVTLKNNSTVNVPVVKSKRPKAYATITGEISTRKGEKTVIKVTPEGDVQTEVLE